ncbi:FAD/NAD(P)-binding domain-containing protein [Didymella exigua CBS 183.55]|uniref:FAD/NAD(P)-binding domain-containing protein n=1 Tax=Didymella exigua CBS 183.55 TaxID=1150837 RepID=A0A6A5R3B6_9PLEO|nr:FAD/NAD(P)-binding domain-containing protein [Didymella exigua CBS 183.55]KAF1922555.1 FAD/NAD(P)-binding domain-containing protein [Didymella exigua CBS 183.55]
MESQQHVRVAVVGSGMAGLVTAHLLKQDCRERYMVKVFESGNTLSLDSASVSISNAARTSSDRVDLPMRAFAGGFYSNLGSMYDYLGIQYQSQPFLFEFAQSKSPYFTHASNLHQLPARLNGVSLISYLLEFGILTLCYVYFSLCCFFIAPHPGETLKAYFDRTWTPKYFATYYVLPLISSVTTCPHESLLAFPASDLTEYKRRTHRAPHYTVSEGVRAVQDRLAKGIQYELNAVVTAVEPNEKGVQLSWRGADGQQRMETFDKVVLAVAPDVVGQVFGPLQHYMARIPTAVVESVVHTDDTVLNQGHEQKLTGKLNHNAQLIHLNTSTSTGHKTESHHIQPCGAIVTTCPFSPLEESRVTHSVSFTRVLRSPQSQRIVNAIFGDTQECYSDEKTVPLWRNGDDNVYLVGGWCWDGMVLLEGCVVSAMRVAKALDIEIPWR